MIVKIFLFSFCLMLVSNQAYAGLVNETNIAVCKGGFELDALTNITYCINDTLGARRAAHEVILMLTV